MLVKLQFVCIEPRATDSACVDVRHRHGRGWGTETAMWVKVEARKSPDCAKCGRSIERGAEVFRPMTDRNYRGARMCTTCGGTAFELVED